MPLLSSRFIRYRDDYKRSLLDGAIQIVPFPNRLKNLFDHLDVDLFKLLLELVAEL